MSAARSSAARPMPSAAGRSRVSRCRCGRGSSPPRSAHTGERRACWDSVPVPPGNRRSSRARSRCSRCPGSSVSSHGRPYRVYDLLGRPTLFDEGDGTRLAYGHTILVAGLGGQADNRRPGRSARTAAVASAPSRPGSRKSISTTSGSSSARRPLPRARRRPRRRRRSRHGRRAAAPASSGRPRCPRRAEP